MLKEILLPLGFEIFEAINGTEAVIKATQHKQIYKHTIHMYTKSGLIYQISLKGYMVDSRSYLR